MTPGPDGSGSRERSGARALLLLSVPLNGTILRALATGPKGLTVLRRKCDSPAQTTLRTHLDKLEAVGAIVKRRRRGLPATRERELTDGGRELLAVAAILERWLRSAPHTPYRLGSSGARAAIKALVEGYSSSMIRVLAPGPLSLTDLDSVIGSLDYPALARRLTAMRRAGQVEARPGQCGNTTPYGVTSWLRRGVAPLAAGARWERRRIPAMTPSVTTADVETAFLLALPELVLSDGLSGICRLGVATGNGEELRVAGATATAQDGRIVSCTVRLGESADAWIVGSTLAWLNAAVDADTAGLELGGYQRLSRGLLDSLHEAPVSVGALPTTLPYAPASG